MSLSYPIPRWLARGALLALPGVLLGALAGNPPAAAGIREEWAAAPIERKLTLLEGYRGSGNPDSLPFLIELFRYPDIRVKMASANALRQWGPDAYPALFSCFEEREIAWLAEAVFVDQEKRATSFLVGKLTSLMPTSRARAASILGKIRDQDSVPHLLKVLGDPVREVRIQAIVALGEMQDERAAGPLLEVFAEGNPLLTEYAIQALEGYGWQGARKFREALRSGNPRVRNGAVQVLRRLGVPESLPDLVAALNDGSPQVRVAAVTALGQFRGKASAEGLLLALRDENEQVAEEAVRNLAAMGPDVTPMLMEKLSDPDARIRRNAVLALRQAGDAAAVPSLVLLLNDPDEAVRTFAVSCLMEMKDPRAVKPLVERLKVEIEIPWLIAYALQSMAEECADELLSAVGNDQFCYTRNIILLRMGERAQEVLLDRASNGSGTSRLTAISLLGQLGDSMAVPALEKLVIDPDVGLLAASALTHLREPGWRVLLDRAHGPDGPERRHSLAAISAADATTTEFLLATLAEGDEAILEAVCRALDRMGPEIIPALAGRLGALPEEGFGSAIGVLCRISNPAAGGALARVLFPAKGQACVDGDRLERLRVTYAIRGSLSALREQVRMEMTGGPVLGR